MVRAADGQADRPGVHKNVQALEKDLRTWIKTWKDGPKPFVWIKTADEILEHLAGYLKRIPELRTLVGLRQVCSLALFGSRSWRWTCGK